MKKMELIFSLALLLVPKDAFAITWKLQVVSNAPSPVQWEEIEPLTDLKAPVQIRGKANSSDLTLIKEGGGETEKVTTSTDGSFQLSIKLGKPITPFRLLVINDLTGNIETFNYVVAMETVQGQYARVLRPRPSEQIPELAIKTQSLRLDSALPRPEGHVLMIEATYPRDKYKLFINNLPVWTTEYGEAILLAEVGQTKLRVEAREPEGKVTVEIIEIKYSERPVKPWSASAVLSVVSNKYKQQGNFPFEIEQMLLGVGGEFHYDLVHQTWFLRSSFLMTPVHLSSNGPNKLSFMDLEGTIAYQLPSTSDWKFELAVGGIFSTTSSSVSTLGYKDLMAPQFYPVARKILSPRSELRSFIRFIPVSEGNLPTFGERILGLGVDYKRQLNSGYELLVGIHFVDVNYKTSPTNSILSQSNILRFGWGF